MVRSGIKAIMQTSSLRFLRRLPATFHASKFVNRAREERYWCSIHSSTSDSNQPFCSLFIKPTNRNSSSVNYCLSRQNRAMSTASKATISTGGKVMTMETGRFASLADGSATVRMDEGLVVLATAVHNKMEAFYHGRRPLTVDYRERAIAVGRIPNTQTRREGGFSDAELRIAALVHRALVM
jgi:hypothetical protein